jgi:hypothetical protein
MPTPAAPKAPLRDIAEATSDDDITPQSSDWLHEREAPAAEPKGVPLSPPKASRGRAVESKRGSHN